ncbi:MAG: alpha-mannosidase, partial [Candidatus Limnocylindrales bacterium]
MSPPTILHVVPHTHWDREWYEPFQTFRMRLVEFVDRILEQMDRDPRFRFTLDGQTITVDDYLEVRPDAEPSIRRFIDEERLAVGPWHVLMDEFLVSAETIVRNLERGWRRSEQLGQPMAVGYLPDMFGHIAQMPQLLRRAGLKDAVVWRGVPAAIRGNAFSWRSPDGSEVRAEYLVGGYGNAVKLFAIPERLGAKVETYIEAMQDWYGDRSVLAMYGTDHSMPVGNLTDLVDEVNARDRRREVRLETVETYLAAARDADPLELPVWAGELRSAARANMLMGVTSARIDLKQAIGRAERWLSRYAEPLATLHGQLWPERLLAIAWDKLIACTAHDSVCGCSIDPVVAQVLSRLDEAEQIARGVADRVLRGIAAELSGGGWVVLNPSPFEREALVELDLPIPEDWPSVTLALPDGSRLATQEISRNRTVIWEGAMGGAEIAEFLDLRLHGRELLGRVLNGWRAGIGEAGHELSLLVDDAADPLVLDLDDVSEAIHAAAGTAPDDPWQVRVLASPRRTLQSMVTVPALGWTSVRPLMGTAAVGNPVRVEEGHLSSGSLDVQVRADGTLRVVTGEAVLDGVGRLVDGGDAGDSYNYGPPPDDVAVDAPAAVQVETLASGPLRGVIAVRRTYEWPAGLADGGRRRSSGTIRHEVTTLVELRAGEPIVRLTLEFENRAEDHRLRLHVPLAHAAEASAAAGSFDVVTRDNDMEGGHG